MFHTLVASGPRARPSSPRLLASVALHGMVIAGAILLTRQRPAPTTTPPLGAPIPFVVPEAHPLADTPARERTPAGRAVMPTWTPEAQIPDVEVAMPTPTLPRVADLLGDAARRAAGTDRPGLTSAGAPGGDGDIQTMASVDDPVAVIEQPGVEYPPALAHAGISGRVELEYVVDTLGRAEPGSVRALMSTRPEFEAAARATILASHFRPARLRGRVVRQIVRQVLSFRAEQ